MLPLCTASTHSKQTLHTPHTHTHNLSLRENEIKQLNGWKSTIDSLAERLSDMLAQKASLAPDAAAEAAAVADVAGGGEGGGDVETGEGGGGGGDGSRVALQAANVQVQINKMR